MWTLVLTLKVSGGGGQICPQGHFFVCNFFSPGFLLSFHWLNLLSSRRVSKKKPSKSTKSVDQAINMSSQGPKIAASIFVENQNLEKNVMKNE